jgi:hypothetical protein
MDFPAINKLIPNRNLHTITILFKWDFLSKLVQAGVVQTFGRCPVQISARTLANLRIFIPFLSPSW